MSSSSCREELHVSVPVARVEQCHVVVEQAADLGLALELPEPRLDRRCLCGRIAAADRQHADQRDESEPLESSLHWQSPYVRVREPAATPRNAE